MPEHTDNTGDNGALAKLRRRIDDLDREMLALLNQRYEVVREIARIKQQKGDHTFHPEREELILRRLVEMNEGPAGERTIRAVWREIFSGARALEEPMRIAFLGPTATFTHEAAISRFGTSAEYIPQPTIADVFEVVERGQVAYGVVPVENSTEGSVTYTLDMLVDTSLRICAEIYRHIHHSLLARCTPDRIEIVYSHPQVFGQCRRWLHLHLPDVRLVEVSSTAEACSRAAREEGAAAIAGELAAAEYGLPVRETRIEDFSENITRFLVLGRRQPEPTGDDKTSMMFVIRDRVGALYDSLAPFREYGINLTFIESRPSRRKRWEYYFFVDFMGHVAETRIRRALDELAEHCQFVKILGSYPRGPEPMD